MIKRIFIAIDLSKAVVDGLKKFRVGDLPVNWTKSENLHITLNFLGAQAEDALPEIFNITEAVAKQFPPQELTLTEARTHRKMIWATLAASPALSGMQFALQDKFLASGLLLRRNLHPAYTPHVCLARSKAELGEADYAPRPLGMKFLATHIVVFESILRPDYPRYISLDAFELTGKT